MILRSGRIKNKMANSGPVEREQEIATAQENVNFKETRGLPNPEVNFSNVIVGRPLTQSSTGAIHIIIKHSAGRGRGFIRINTETEQNKYQTTNENRRTNKPNKSLLWDGIDLPVPDLSKSTNPQLDKEITGYETFQTLFSRR